MKNIFNPLKNYKTFHYPFGAKAAEHFNKSDEIKLFTYGSLLNKDSALRTMDEQTYNSRITSVAFGYKRIFNRDVDIAASARYTTPDNHLERGMLNLLSTENADDVVNGFIFDFKISALQAMCEREEGYDLVPCVVQPWDAFCEKQSDHSQMSVAYTFVAPHEERSGVCPVSHEVLPVKEYFDLVKEGVSIYGEDFLQKWYDTTFLADKETPIADWEKQYEAERF